MNTNECRCVRREIDQSELGQRLSESSESHVIGCASCAAFRAERTRLRELVGSLQPVTAPADFDMRLRARIAREQDQPAQPSIFRLFMSTPAIAVAGLIVMVVGGLVWMNQASVQPPTTTASNQPAPPKPTTRSDASTQPAAQNNQATPAAETPKGRDLSI